MASPDVTPYVDLTLYDKQPDEIVSEAVDYARVAVPEFEYATGSIEDALLQASAYMTGVLSGAINRMTSGTLEILLQLLGVTRDSGTSSTATATFTLIDTLGHTVPAGTRVGYTDRSDPLNPVLYTWDTAEDLTIAGGSSSGSVELVATATKEYPSLTTGTTLQLYTPISYVSTVSLATDVSSGSDAETDAEFFSRAVARFNELSESLATTSQFESYVLNNYSDVYRCKAYSRVNPASGSDIADSPENGYVTIYAAKVGGASLSPTASSIIEADLANRAVAGLNINVEPPFLVTVPVGVTVVAKSGYMSTDVIANVTNAINSYIHPDYWNWGTKIYYNELIAYIDSVEGVERVNSLTINSLTSDYSFTKYGTLPTATLSVGVI